MSDSASDATEKEPPFVEGDRHQTWLPYDHGGVPLFIAIIWGIFIITYIAVMSMLALPDLRAWLEHS